MLLILRRPSLQTCDPQPSMRLSKSTTTFTFLAPWKREWVATARARGALTRPHSLVSTMETSTVSARNAVALYLEKVLGFDFVNGGKDCPWEPPSASSSAPDWAGWGCQSG